MKTPTQTIDVIDVFGLSSQISLGPVLASGGAGTVYEVASDPLSVVKLYHPQVIASDGDSYRQRVESMLDLRPDLPDIQYQGHRHVQLAWPTHAAYVRKKFVGFVMPALEIARTKNLELAINEKQATRAGIRTDLGARITLARQLTGVVAALHERGHYVIDLKPVNIQFFPDSLLMAVLDCDGFNIHDHKSQRRFAAPQYTPDYLAPEFQNNAANPNDHPEQQDRFALAVILFQLLNHGIHPYSGRLTIGYEPSTLEGRIARGYYPFGVNSHPAISPSPMSGHECIPGGLRLHFDCAFGPHAGVRPTAREWRDALESYANVESGRLRKCSAGHVQFAATQCSVCLRNCITTALPSQKESVRTKLKTTVKRRNIRPNSTSTRRIPTPVASATTRDRFYGFLVFCFMLASLWLLWKSIGGAGNYWFVFFTSMFAAGCIGYLAALSDADPDRLVKSLGSMVVLGLPLFLMVGGIKYGYAWWNEKPETKAVQQVDEMPPQSIVIKALDQAPQQRAVPSSPKPSDIPVDESKSFPSVAEGSDKVVAVKQLAPAVIPTAREDELNLDNIYAERIKVECTDFLSFICRERVRWDLCDGRWSETHVAGAVICRLSSR